jgi:hypothetical protein
MKYLGTIGIIVGILGGLAGLTVGIIADPVFGSIFGIIFLSIFGGVFWAVLFKPMMVRKKLAKNGVPATAKILEIHDTGVTVNNSPQVKLLVEVNSSVSGTYLVETKQIISRVQVPQFQPGAMFTVLVDPNDKNLISFDAGSTTNNTGSTGNNTNSVVTGPWAGISGEEAERRLAEIDRKNKDLLVTGLSARAIVTKYTWLGIYVNGNNPAVELEIEILPANEPAFNAKVIGVINEIAVSKYQPGEDIYVKYDSYNKKKVTIEHS